MSSSFSLQELGYCYQLIRSQTEFDQQGQYLAMLIDTIQERVYLSDARSDIFWDLADQFLLHAPPPANMWQQILGHLASLELFVPRGSVGMHSLQWQLRFHWSASLDDPVIPVPVLEECQTASVVGYRRRDRSREFLPRCHSLLFSITLTLLGWVGGCICRI